VEARDPAGGLSVAPGGSNGRLVLRTAERFTDKIAVVTGGASGIGLATAGQLAREGAQIVVSDWSRRRGEAARDALSEQGLPVEFQHHDAGDTASWDALEQWLSRRFGRLDLLVNNAYSGVAGRLETMTPQIWRDSMRVNAEGTILGMQLAGRLMGRGGAIVNLSSVAAFSAADGSLGYAAAKLAVVHLTKAAAFDFAKRDPQIRVNAVAPGTIDTPTLRSTLRAMSGLPKDGDVGASMEAAAKHTPLGRVGAAEEVASVIAFLLSDEASFVTGQCLLVDGGLSLK
jgi:NAD(P)-dependent dehydrogenase (short-subunit alcohol dehydrogenase family)